MVQNEISCDDVRLDAEHILALLRQTIWVLGNKDTNYYMHMIILKVMHVKLSKQMKLKSFSKKR